jgi:hypothetical protein
MTSPFWTFSEKLYHDQHRAADLEKMSRLIEAGYSDLVDHVRDGEIDIDTAM